MSLGDWFVAAIGTLQVCAAISYAAKKQYIVALIWLGAACISFGTLTLTLKAK